MPGRELAAWEDSFAERDATMMGLRAQAEAARQNRSPNYGAWAQYARQRLAQASPAAARVIALGALSAQDRDQVLRDAARRQLADARAARVAIEG